MQSTEYRHYRTAVVFSLALWLLLVVLLLIWGKEDSFLLINGLHSPSLDRLFRYYTFLGHGMIWVPLVLYVLFFRRSFIIALLAAAVFCTLFTQGLKHAFDDMRPIHFLKDRIHVLDDFSVHRNHSFPSGHTSTAFTLALLLAFLAPGRFWPFFLPLVAFFVGYSRIYLSQHFPTDVCAGMAIGILSSWLALLVYERFRKPGLSNAPNGATAPAEDGG